MNTFARIRQGVARAFEIDVFGQAMNREAGGGEPRLVKRFLALPLGMAKPGQYGLILEDERRVCREHQIRQPAHRVEQQNLCAGVRQ